MGIDDKFILNEKKEVDRKQVVVQNKKLVNNDKLIYNKPFIKPLTKNDFEYFKKYCISLETLRIFKISRLTYIETKKIINNREVITTLTFRDNEVAYYYKAISIVDKSVKDVGFKVHIPPTNIKPKKFLSYCSFNALYYNPGLFSKLNNIKEDYLIFTKSMKDSMCLYEMGYLAFSTINETVNIENIGGFIKFIINRANSLYNKSFMIILMFDNDDTGKRFTIQFNKYLLEILKIKSIIVFLETKDVSDLIKAKGIKYSISKLKSIIKDSKS